MDPYQVAFPDSALEDLRRRLSATRWPVEIDGGDDWARGVPAGYLRELAEYWRDSFDWRAVEARLNAFPQFLTEVDGARVHVLHVRSPEPDATPLLITPGWPGSVLEFLDVIGPLTDPRAHGGDPDRAFHLVVATVPGFGLSGPNPAAGWDTPRVARAWAQIMQRLGYQRYLVQGGDLGSWIGYALAAIDAEHVAGLQVNFLVTVPTELDDLSEIGQQGLARLDRMQAYQADGAAYFAVQGSRPHTIAYPLTDSPVGQLAWVVEKYREWSDCTERPEEVIDRDVILANVTLTWLTATAGSSAQFYYEVAPQTPGAPTATPPPPLTVPLGVSVYPADPVPPVRELAERRYPTLAQWCEHDSGGHFAHLEKPEWFVADVREFAALVGTGAGTGAGAGAGSQALAGNRS